MQSCISYYINNLTIAYYSSGFVKWNLSESIRDTVILLFFLYLFRILLLLFLISSCFPRSKSYMYYSVATGYPPDNSSTDNYTTHGETRSLPC